MLSQLSPFALLLWVALVLVIFLIGLTVTYAVVGRRPSNSVTFCAGTGAACRHPVATHRPLPCACRTSPCDFDEEYDESGVAEDAVTIKVNRTVRKVVEGQITAAEGSQAIRSFQY